MDFETYRKEYFTDPSPEQRYNFKGDFGVTLFYQDYEAAIAYYEQVLGPPAYLEEEGTRGWQVGCGWLTLIKGKSGNPRNLEVTFNMLSPEEAEALQRDFIEAGGIGPAPSDELMYKPIRYCAVSDPFGVNLLVISPLPKT
jgi:hypothetical protein